MGGYDVVTEVNERVINRIIASAFYKSRIIDRINGEVEGVKYTIHLKEPPTVDQIKHKQIRLISNIYTVIKLYGLEFDIETLAFLNASYDYEPISSSLILDFKKIKVSDIEISDKNGWLNILSWKINLPNFILSWFNKILARVVSSALLDDIEELEIVKVLTRVELPKMPDGDSNKLTVTLGEIKAFKNDIAVATNFLEYTGGNITQVKNFTNDFDTAVGISEDAVHRVFDFWWDRTTFEKQINARGQFNIEVLRVLGNAVGAALNLSTKLATFGFLETELIFRRAWMEFGVIVDYDKPKFNIRNNETIHVTSCPFKVTLWCKLRVRVTERVEFDRSGWIPDIATPFFEDDVTIQESTFNLTLVDLSLPLNFNVDDAKAKISLNSDNMLVGTITECDFDINTGWGLADDILDVIIDWVTDYVRMNLPPIPLSPALFVTQVPETGTILEFDIDNLDFSEEEMIIQAGVSVQGLKRMVRPVPKYIVAPRQERDVGIQALGSASNGVLGSHFDHHFARRLIHRLDCKHLDHVSEKNKWAYYVLSDALLAQHLPCPHCLPRVKLPSWVTPRGPF